MNIKINYIKKIRNWFLIFKNGLGIISKFKVLSLIFFLLTIIFSLIFSSLFEINRQLNNQIFESGVDDFNPDKIYSLSEEYLTNQKHKNIFCNDYSEITIGNKIKRFPNYSFGENGCFKKIKRNQIKIKYKTDKNTKQILSVENVTISKENIKINYSSVFYIGTIHQKLMQKYKETINEKYKILADKLIEVFLLNEKIGIKKIIEEKIKTQINLFLKHNEIYFGETIKEILLSNININKIISNSYNKKKVEELLKETNETLLKENKEQIKNDWKNFKKLINEIKEKQLDPIFEEKNINLIIKKIKKSIGKNIEKKFLKINWNLKEKEIEEYLNFNEENKLKLKDFNKLGDILDSTFIQKRTESYFDYLKRLTEIKKWVKEEEGEIINFFEKEILKIIKKDDGFLIKKLTKEILDNKFKVVFKNKNSFYSFLIFFIKTINNIFLNENNNEININLKKINHYILNNYSRFKEKILNYFNQNKLIIFWQNVKKIKEFLKNKDKLILNSKTYSLKNIIKKPIKFERTIDENELKNYLDWLKNINFIKNSVFYNETNYIKINNFINELNLWINDENKIINMKFKNIIPENFENIIENYSENDLKKIKNITNNIKKYIHILNFWTNKIKNETKKIINWSKKYWFLFPNNKIYKEQLKNFEEKINEFEKEINLNNIVNITNNLKENKKLYINFFRNYFYNNEEIKFFNNSFTSLWVNDVKEIIKKINKYSINFLYQKTKDNKFNFANLLNLLDIQNYLIQEKKQKELESDFQNTKKEIKKILNNFHNSRTLSEKIKIIQKKTEQYKEWVKKINETWNKIYGKNNEFSIEQKIIFFKKEKFISFWTLNKKIKSLEKQGFDPLLKKIKLKTKDNNFFIEKIINNLANNKNTNKKILSIFLNIDNENKKTIEEKITTFFLKKRGSKQELGFHNEKEFEYIYLNDLIYKKKIKIKLIFEKNYENIEYNINQKIKKDKKLNSKIMKIEFGFYNEKIKIEENEVIGKYLKLNFKLIKNNEEKNIKEIKEELEKILINIEKKILKENITNLNYWFYENNIINDFTFGKDHLPFYYQNENKIWTILLHKIVAEINNIEYKKIVSTRIFDAVKKKTTLIIENDNNDESFKLHLIKGDVPILNNEIVITPIFAKKNNLEIGNTLNILNKEMKIVGIGSQTPFIFPAGDTQKPLDVEENLIVYISKNFQNKIWWSSRNQVKPVLIEKNNHIFLSGKKSDIENFEKDLFINKNSFTNKTMKLNHLKTNIKEKEIIDDNYQNLKLQNFDSKLNNYEYHVFKKIIKLIQKSFNLTSILICLLIFFVWLFSAYNLIKKKIKDSKTSLGFLKTQGVKNYELLFSYVGLLPPIFFSIIIGIFLNFFIQRPIFNKLEEYLSLNFKTWNISFYNFVIPILVIPIIFILLILFLNWFNIERKKIKYLITTIDESVSNFLEIKFKNFVINKFIPKKNIMTKINLIFFLTVWKKILILFIIVFFFTTNLISTIYLLRLPSSTIEKQFRKTNNNFEMKYIAPTWNNPFTFNNAYAVEGIEGLKKRSENNNLGLYPIEKIVPQIYYSNDKDLKNKTYHLYWNADKRTEETYKNFLVFHTPLYGSSFNIEYIKRIMKKLNKKNRKQFCELIFKSIFRNKLNYNKNNDCLKEIEKIGIPIKTIYSREFEKILTNQLPATSNRVKFNKKTDFLSLIIKGEIDDKNKSKFNLIGIDENSDRLFIHDWSKELKKENKINEINVVANQVFLDKYNLKIGDVIEFKHEISTLYLKGKKEPYKIEDWKFLPIGKNINDFEKTETRGFWNWNRNAKFYKGSYLNTLKKFKVDKETGQVMTMNENNEWKKITLFNKYFNEKEQKWKYIKMIDIERILLYQNKNEYIRILLGNELKYGNDILKRPSTWWDKNIKTKLFVKKEWKIPENNDKKIKLRITNKIETYNKPNLFLDQNKLIKLMNYKNYTDENNYVGNTKFYNILYSNSNEITDAILFGFTANVESGYFDIDTVDGSGINNKINLNIYSNLIVKNILFKIISYILNLSLISIIFNIISSLFLFFFILKELFEKFKNLTMNLKVIGYSNKKLLKQIIIIITFPVIAAFIISSILIKLLFTSAINFVKNYNFYLFIDEGYWVFILSFLIIFICFIFIIWKYSKSFKNINFSEFLKL